MLPLIHIHKQIPAPLRRLCRPWLVLSLALHALVILVPMLPDGPSESIDLESLAQSDAVDIVQLPPTTPPAPPRPIAPPSPIPQPAPIQQAPPRPQPPAPSSPAPPGGPVAPPVTPPAASPPVASPSPSPVASPTPSPVPSPTPTPSPSPSPVPYADFPHLANSEATCAGTAEDCYRVTTGESWRQIAVNLEAELREQGYALEDQTDALLSGDISGRRIFQVSRGEERYYLHVISTFSQGTLYLLRPDPLSVAEMDQIAGGD